MPQDHGTPAGAISDRELYLLRRAELRHRRKLLEAQLAQQAFQELRLQVERKYGLLGTNGQLDVHAGRIVKEGPNGPGADAHQGASRPT